MLERKENWKEFELGELFSSISGDFDIKREHINDKGLPVITSGVENYGILGLSDVEAKVIPRNTITVDMFGNLFYRNFDYKMVTHARVFGLVPKFEMSERIGLYLCTTLFYLKDKFDYSHMCSFRKIRKEQILLPEKDGEPDWKYMEEYIKYIENKHIENLKAKNDKDIKTALEVVGLTESDLECYLSVEPPNRVEEFRVGDLFEIKPTTHHNLTNDLLYSNDGENPVIANSSQNNGVTGYTNLNLTEKGNIITFSDTTDHNSVFYQPRDFVGYSHVQGLYPIKHTEKWNKEALLYFLTVFKKKASSKNFSYGNKFNRKIASDFILELPALDDSTPDFDYMEKAIYTYIKQYIKSKKISGEQKIRLLKSLTSPAKI